MRSNRLLRLSCRLHPLRIQNSLSRTKVSFIPKDPSRVLWYQCGPTVYAESHMGHARTYVALDVLRRIMQDFFGYNVILCQNITDIDDKIIIRSSEKKIPFRELASKYESEVVACLCLLLDVSLQMKIYNVKCLIGASSRYSFPLFYAS